ncbi:tetratricopeptide repeat protein, partial [Candidatus Gottesmanbacteria bacterium]|nr:tetratricopeptide repeat protein [Candidatus Gottesmanbacteria bacterium]
MIAGNQQWKTLHIHFPYHVSKWISLALFLVLLGVAVLLIMLSRIWYADMLFASGYRYARANQYALASPLFTRAIALNPSEPLYHDEQSTALSSLTADAVELEQATTAASRAKQALTESDTAITISPKNVNFWKSRTKIFYSFSVFDPKFNPAAIQALTRALELSPNDPKILYNLAILYGRQNDNTKAIELLQKAIAIKPNYRDAYFALNIFYQETRQTQKARDILTEYLAKVDPNDKDFIERLKQ